MRAEGAGRQMVLNEMLELAVHVVLCYSPRHTNRRGLERMKTSNSVGCGPDSQLRRPSMGYNNTGTLLPIDGWLRWREVQELNINHIQNLGGRRAKAVCQNVEAPAADSRTNKYAGNVHQDARQRPPALLPSRQLDLDLYYCLSKHCNLR